MKMKLFRNAATGLLAILMLAACQTTQKSSGGNTTAQPAPKSAETASDTRAVKGIDGWEGEITGKPAPKSSFTKLQIGMGMKQVTDLVGQPTDQGAYVTGKAWIPFYFGSDTYRHELVYKGLGRLIFAGGGVGNYHAGHLIHIIHNANEGGYR